MGRLPVRQSSEPRRTCSQVTIAQQVNPCGGDAGISSLRFHGLRPDTCTSSSHGDAADGRTASIRSMQAMLDRRAATGELMQAIRVHCQVFRTWNSKHAVAFGDVDVQPYQSVPADADPLVVAVIVRQLSGPTSTEADYAPRKNEHPNSHLTQQAVPVGNKTHQKSRHDTERSKLAPRNPR